MFFCKAQKRVPLLHPLYDIALLSSTESVQKKMEELLILVEKHKLTINYVNYGII